MKSILGSLAALMLFHAPAFGSQVSQILASDASHPTLGEVSIGAVITGYKSVDSGITCSAESDANPNSCGIIQEPITAPTLVVDVPYTSQGANCHPDDDGGDPSSCDAYLSARISPELYATIESRLKQLGLHFGARQAYLKSFVSNFTVTPKTYTRTYKNSTPVDCDFSEDSGQYSGPDCHWVDGPTKTVQFQGLQISVDIQTN